MDEGIDQEFNEINHKNIINEVSQISVNYQSQYQGKSKPIFVKFLKIIIDDKEEAKGEKVLLFIK